MPVYANRVWMSTATTGTGTITLGTAQTGYITFAQGGIADASSVTYTIIDGNDFEVGRGTYTSSGTTLSRDTVLVSLISGTSGTTKLTLSGTATVFITQSAEDVETPEGYLDIVSAAGTTTLTSSSARNIVVTGSTTQTIRLPDVTTLLLGWTFIITNTSTGTVTVQSSGANSFSTTLTAGAVSRFVCIAVTGTTTASWVQTLDGATTRTGTGGLVYAVNPALFGPTINNARYTLEAITAGTNAQGQGAIAGSTEIAAVTTTAANPSGVTLNTAAAGKRTTVFNLGTNPIVVYPLSGTTINALAVNAGITLPVGYSLLFEAQTATQWRTQNLGTAGQFLESNGASSAPTWASIANTDISGLGTMSTQNANSVAITGGSITGITDLTVADGGTGASSFTAYSVVVGGTTSTGALQNVSGVGTAGQVLTSAGAGAIPTWATLGGYTLLDTQTFNSSGTWTKTGITGSPKFCVVWLWGGGGGGGRGSTDAPGGGGGGGGCNVFVFPYAQLAATQSVTVGNGGNGRTSANQAGGTGGDTTFATFAVAHGAGGGGVNSAGGGGGGGGGTASQGSDASNQTGASGGSAGNPNESDPTEIYGWYGFSVDTAVVSTSGELTTTDYIPIKTSRTYWMSRTSAGATGGNGGNAVNTVGGSTTVASNPFGGGGGGGGQDSASAWTVNSNGGAAYYGGGGGGAGSSVAPSSGTQAGGVSTFGGNGGAGTTGATAATAGSQPGGGGGGTETGNSGAGGAGRVIVYTYG